MVREWTWRRLASGYRQFVTLHRLDGQPQLVAASSTAGLRANPLLLYPAWQAASFQTTIAGWLALNAAPKAACQSGLDLFCFNEPENLKDKLNNAVALERAKRNQLRSSRDNNPESGMRKKIHVSK